MANRNRLNIPCNSPLLGRAAALCFFRLIGGYANARNYRYSRSYAAEYGVFYDANVQRWIAFDNRGYEMFIDDYKFESEALEALIETT